MKFVYRILLLLLIPLMFGYPGYSSAEEALDRISGEKMQAIEQRIVKQMKAGKIPGLSVVLVEGDRTVYQKALVLPAKRRACRSPVKPCLSLGLPVRPLQV